MRPGRFLLKDLDGDGRADLREVLLTGFATNGSTQLRVSHPTLGPDNWIYLSGGLSGGKVSSPLSPQTPAIDISRSEIRFRLEMGQGSKVESVRFEAVDGKGQFGLTIDDFGHRFTCMNRVQPRKSFSHPDISSEIQTWHSPRQCRTFPKNSTPA